MRPPPVREPTTAGGGSSGPLKSDQVKRLKELEAENARLRRAVSDLTLDKQILAEAPRGRDDEERLTGEKTCGSSRAGGRGPCGDGGTGETGETTAAAAPPTARLRWFRPSSLTPAWRRPPRRPRREARAPQDPSSAEGGSSQ